MPKKGRDVIVIGTSAGGLEALDQLIGQLPTDLPASIVTSSTWIRTTRENRCCDGWAATRRFSQSSLNMASA
jgi:hypothetical protein